MSRILSLVFLCVLFVSCSSRKSGWDKSSEAVKMDAKEYETISSSAKKLWKERQDTAKLEEALKHFEKIHAAKPKDLETLIYLTRGYYFLGDAHYQDVDKKKATYQKAAEYGEMAMATNEKFAEQMKAGKSVEESLGVLTKREVPAIYWTAANLGKWARATGISATLKYKGQIKAMVERVEKLQPDYFHGAVGRYWGGYYAVAPTFAGGDMKKSKAQFEKSMKMAPDYQGTKVLMADVYYTKLDDKANFEKLLKEVLASKQDNHPEIGPENALEKKKAQKLLDRMGELF